MEPTVSNGLLDSKRFTDLEAQVSDLQRRVAALEQNGQKGGRCIWCDGRGERLYGDGMMHTCTRCRGTGREPA